MEELTQAYRRYKAGHDYNTRINFYSTVSENLDYLIGEQWGDLGKESDTPIATLNFEKMIHRYKTAAIASQQITATYLVENIDEEATAEDEKQIVAMAKLLSGNADILWEKQKMDSKVRRWISDAWTTGDMCAYVYWDATVDTGQKAKGEICIDRVSPGSVFFGNPNTKDVQKQPYILILTRETIYDLRQEAKRYGMSNDDIEKIGSDLDTDVQLGKYKGTELQGEDAMRKCNAYLTFWREDGYVYWSKCTNSVVIREKVPLKTKRYPIAWEVWEDVENSYHGRAESTGIHNVQRFVNKMYALCMMWMINNSLGRIAYDETMIQAWSNDIGAAIPVNGNPSNVIQQLRSGDFNNAILQVIDSAIKYTRDFCGVTDASLGQGRADNTSAIIALGKQAAISLENQQHNLRQFVEDIYLILGEMMVQKYVDKRRIPIREDGKIRYYPFDASLKDRLLLNVKIEVGASTIWSEEVAARTLDNMLLNKVVDDIQYLERLPNGYVSGKTKLIEEKKALRQETLNQSMPMTDDADYELMAQFMETLPQEEQVRLRALSPDQMQQEVINLMAVQ